MNETIRGALTPEQYEEIWKTLRTIGRRSN